MLLQQQFVQKVCGKTYFKNITMSFIPPQKIPLVASGDISSAEPIPVFQQTFEYGVDNTELTINTEVNSGVVEAVTGTGICRTTAVIGSKALLRSKAHVRYRSGQGGIARFTAKFNGTSSEAKAGSFQGLGDEEGTVSIFKNGGGIGTLGGVTGIYLFSLDATTTIPQSAWDDPLDGTGKSKMTWVKENQNYFEVIFAAGLIEFRIRSNSIETLGKIVVFHKLVITNVTPNPAVENSNFYHYMYAFNGTSTDIVSTGSAEFAHFVAGFAELALIHRPQFGTDIQKQSSLAGIKTPLWTIRVKENYAGRKNLIDILLENLEGSIEANAANNLATIILYKNMDLSTGTLPSYSDINTTDSIVEIDTTATIGLGGKFLIGLKLAGKNGKDSKMIKELDFIIRAGETVTAIADSVANADYNSDLLWQALF